MEYYVGLDVSLKQTAICVVDGDCGVVWQGCADTHPEMILSALDRWVGKSVFITHNEWMNATGSRAIEHLARRR